MRDYFRKLEERVRKYSRKYANRPRKAALRLAFWNLICCFRSQVIPKKESLPAIQHKIAVRLLGGLGDQLVGCNYLSYLSNRFKNLRIDIYGNSILPGLFFNIDVWNGDFFSEKCHPEDLHYDAVVELIRYPRITFLSPSVEGQVPDFFEYVCLLKKFEEEFPDFLSHCTRFDGVSAQYSAIIGKKRIQQPDVYGYLGIEERFSYDLPFKITDICERYRLEPGKFITIHRGCDASQSADSVKLWPMKHYNELLSLIKSWNPHLTVVQLGVNEERCPAMDYVDCNLVGKTTLSDILTVLKSSMLHIDSEGGLVHMRHALSGGKSIVLFGPTSQDFFGYSENINLRSDVCPFACEHIRADWNTFCIKSNSNVSVCMEELMPEIVFSWVKKVNCF